MEVDIYSYTHYRSYLKDKFEELRSKKRYFTQSYFAKIAGLGSNSYLRMIINGERNLKVDTIRRFARALKLNKNEAAYFETLVLFNQSKTDPEQDDYFNELTRLRPKKKLKELSKDQFEYFSNRYFVTIREMSALPHFQDDPQWISEHLHSQVSPQEAKHALEVLERLGLLVRNADNKLVHSNTTLTTEPQIESMEIYKYNRDILSEAKKALVELPSSQTDISSITIPMPLKALKEVGQILHKCREEIAHYLSNLADGFDEVYQINMQAYPLTKIMDKTDSEKEKP